MNRRIYLIFFMPLCSLLSQPAAICYCVHAIFGRKHFACWLCKSFLSSLKTSIFLLAGMWIIGLCQLSSFDFPLNVAVQLKCNLWCAAHVTPRCGIFPLPSTPTLNPSSRLPLAKLRGEKSPNEKWSWSREPREPRRGRGIDNFSFLQLVLFMIFQPAHTRRSLI